MATTDVMKAPSLGYASDEETMGDTNDNTSPISAEKRIFVNRAVNLHKIQYYGFDMDYTLCEYISPEFDILAFDLAKQFMVDNLNYPTTIMDLEYNKRFPTRGLWYDRVEGNLLKVDQFGKILVCCHGFRLVQGQELRRMYPNKIQRKEESRVYVMNTLFNLAETHLIASLTHFMDNRSDAAIVEGGWKVGSDTAILTYNQLFEDLREAIENLHEERILKIKTVENLHKYVKKDPRLPEYLTRIRESGRKTFLLTNSDWWYTQHIMRYILGDKDTDSWLSYFDLSIVDARKPKFFNLGTKMHFVDTNSGSKVAVEGGVPPSGPLVYSGGDHETVRNMLGAAGPDVIYCGDHLYADVVKCRKLCEWRTLLIVPELEHEVSITRSVGGLLPELQELEAGLGSAEDEEATRSRIWDNVKRLDGSFGHTGSIFRAGTRLSYFGSHVLYWADLYTGSVNNLAEYSVNMRFGGPSLTLPHETVISQEAR